MEGLWKARGASIFLRIVVVSAIPLATLGCLIGGGVSGFFEGFSGISELLSGFSPGGGTIDSWLDDQDKSVGSGYVWDDEEHESLPGDSSSNPASDDSSNGPADHTVDQDDPTTTHDPIKMVYNPEPVSLALFGAGLAGVAIRRRRHAHRA